MEPVVMDSLDAEQVAAACALPAQRTVTKAICLQPDAACLL